MPRYTTVILLMALACQEPSPRAPQIEVGEQEDAGRNSEGVEGKKIPRPVKGEDPDDDINSDISIADITGLEDSSQDDPVVEEPDNSRSEPNPNWSMGKGGQTGFLETSFTASNGARSTYKIRVPDDIGADKAYGLHVHLHGDGGGGYRDFPNKETRNNLVGVTVKAPNFNLQWGRAEGTAHARYVDDLIQSELMQKYNIDKTRIFFSGVSGGAYFLTGSFIPMFGYRYNGALILCGGETPRSRFVNREFLKTFRIHFEVTANERPSIMRSVQNSISAYRQAVSEFTAADPGFDANSVFSATIEGRGGHCQFDGLGYTPGIQSIIDRKFPTLL